MIEREQGIEALAADTFDVLVIGGGITGAGVALDAATRGYTVALIERHDFASGTSSRSSKLVHGGLRYLQQFDLGLVREALLERQLMVKLAPHLVKPLPMIVPAFDDEPPDRIVGAGLSLYDVMSRESLRRRRRRDDDDDGHGFDSDWSPERHRTISGHEVLERAPALAPREPFFDQKVQDVMPRIALMTAQIHGAANPDGEISVNLDQAFVIALIIIIARPWFARHELHGERFACGQFDMPRGPALALRNCGIENDG